MTVRDRELRPDVASLLQPWIARQRWYVGSGSAPALEYAGHLRFPDPEGEVGIDVVLLRDRCGPSPVTYQVPLTARREPVPELEHALITATEDEARDRWWIYDGPHDPAYVAALLAAITEGTGSDHAGDHDAHAVGRPSGPPADGRWSGGRTIVRSQVLRGEQSNSSIIVEASGPGGAPAPVIVKVFRVLHAGSNPDVELQTALHQGGCPYVPAAVGSLAGSWRSDDGSIAQGYLAFAQEYLPGTRDAWRVAGDDLASGAGANTPFRERARELGAATAAVHTALAAAFATAPADDSRRTAVLASWEQRWLTAVADAPELAEFADAVRGVFARAAAVTWPRLQRVHGDYHLGQVLDVPGRGWVLLDFEGEPLRPLSERNQPDLAIRDVAGMLRSFDYAAGARALAAPEAAAEAAAWAAACRAAFLDGYAQVADDPEGTPEAAALLGAFELDKALYEVSYETRFRPDWSPIPIGAVLRLVDAESSDTGPPVVDPAADASHSSGFSPLTRAPDRPAASTATTSHEIEVPMSTPSTSEPNAPAAGPAEPVAPPAPPRIRPASWDELGLLVHGGHGNPHGVLGAHPWRDGVTIRALRPMATSVKVELPDGSLHPMEHDFEGVWQIQLDIPEVTDYRLRVTYADGFEHRQDDPYRFVPTLGEVDLHLIGEGRHEELWKVLGSHVRDYDGPMGEVHGTSFAVWAPNARAIRLTGDFNHWDGTAYPMRALGSSGIWELFVPGVGENATYKYEILGADGYRRSKADPLARATECPPATASVVTRSHYTWSDQEWMDTRARNTSPQDGPMSIYEVHLGSWRQGLSYTELAEHLVNYVRDIGFTHVEFLPVAEHPYGPSWGYQVTGYYAPTSRFGSPDEFRYLVDRLHQEGIGVIVDWVPAHFPKDGFALGRFDGQPLYEHPDWRRGEHKEWGTYIFDFGRPQVRNFLVANACFWLEEYHIDGLRVDAVASMLYLDYSREDGEWYPNQYGGRENIEAMQLLQETNATLYRRYPGAMTLAEESTSWGGVTKPTYMGGLGFGLKWNMGWMHDVLGYISLQPIHRQYHHNEMTFAMVYQYSENFCLPISHDEVVYGKGSMLMKLPGDRWEQLAQLRTFYAYMWSHPGKQLLFMGSEFAQYAEWADGASLDWWLLDHEPHWRMHALVKDLNWLYRSHPALWEQDNDPAGMRWIDANDATGNCFSFLRYGRKRGDGHVPVLACISNFSGMEHHDYRIGLPHPGPWREVLNTDSTQYGGGGIGNLGQVTAEEVPWHGLPYSATITIAKMGTVWFEPGPATHEQVVHEAPESVPWADAVPGSGQPLAGGGGRRGGPGAQRPELSGTPVMAEEVKDSGLGELPPVIGEEVTQTQPNETTEPE